MEEAVRRKLLAINHEFYQTFGSIFSSTRGRLQPGVEKILSRVPNPSNILEIGCGNGALARWLNAAGHTGVYLGLDFSPVLLAIARNSLENVNQDIPARRNQEREDGSRLFTFLEADLYSQSWDFEVRKFLDQTKEIDRFDLVLAFAALHHLPGRETHLTILNKIYALLKDNGRFIHSNWQFLNSQRLRQRIQPWHAVGIEAEEVGEGDYLLDWRQGGYSLRYVHHFEENELASLAQATGFEVTERFYSDGEGGNLSLYQVWQKAS